MTEVSKLGFGHKAGGRKSRLIQKEAEAMRRTGGKYYTFAMLDGTELHEIYNSIEEAEAGAKQFTRRQVETGHTDNTEKIIIKTTWSRTFDKNGCFLFDLREKRTIKKVFAE